MSAIDVLVSAALGGAVALAATLTASALPGLRLATRRALVVAGLVVAALAPLVALVAGSLGLGLRPAAVSKVPLVASPGPSPAPQIEVRIAATPSGGSASAPPTIPSSPRTVARPMEPKRSFPWPLFTTFVWLAGTAIALGRLGAGLRRVRSIRRSLRTPRDPRLEGLFLSDAVEVPATVGILLPVVVMPPRLARDLSDDDLAAVRRHEASHVARRDPLAGFVARLARALHWPNPIVHLAARRLDVLCESIADAEVVRARPDGARRYAACLVRLAERALIARVPTGVHGIVGARHALTSRVEALLDPNAGQDPRPTWAGRLGVAALALLAVGLAACCCRGPTPPPPTVAAAYERVALDSLKTENPRLLPLSSYAGRRDRTSSVAGFSPVALPLSSVTGQANPTYTDGQLRVNTHAAYPGRICIFFEAGTRIDPKSVFVAGDPRLGLDLEAVQILRFTPGTGNVPIRLAAGGVEVRDDRILFTPALPLPEGQYSIGVLGKLRGVDGRALAPAPVFHSFTVGSADTIAPLGTVDIGFGRAPSGPDTGVRISSIAIRGSGVGATWHRGDPAGSYRLALSGNPDVSFRFTEPIASASVTPQTFRVVDVGAVVPNGGESPPVSAARGSAMLRSHGEESAAGTEIFWRPDLSAGGLPLGTTIRVTVVGSDGGKNAHAITDVAGNPLSESYEFEFTLRRPPPTLPTAR